MDGSSYKEASEFTPLSFCFPPLKDAATKQHIGGKMPQQASGP
jgi:hypothetical protein